MLLTFGVLTLIRRPSRGEASRHLPVGKRPDRSLSKRPVPVLSELIGACHAQPLRRDGNDHDGNDTDEVTGNAVAVLHLDRTPATMDLILFEVGDHDPMGPAAAPQNLFTMRPVGIEPTHVPKQGPDDDGLWMARGCWRSGSRARVAS